ncbi:MAG TPA: hypothetical protein VKT82_13690 [Ktedonobacterales bacterium]|nr:hypothetical protein [Ktedonobacterales bacterium]
MLHMLVVGDDDEIRATLYDFLMEEGYQVSLAQHGFHVTAMDYSLVALARPSQSSRRRRCDRVLPE